MKQILGTLMLLTGLNVQAKSFAEDSQTGTFKEKRIHEEVRRTKPVSAKTPKKRNYSVNN